MIFDLLVQVEDTIRLLPSTILKMQRLSRSNYQHRYNPPPHTVRDLRRLLPRPVQPRSAGGTSSHGMVLALPGRVLPGLRRRGPPRKERRGHDLLARPVQPSSAGGHSSHGMVLAQPGRVLPERQREDLLAKNGKNIYV